MKTIGYYDRCDGNKRIKVFHPKNTIMKKTDRIIQAFNNLQGLGNVVIVFIDGNKTRRIGTRGF